MEDVNVWLEFAKQVPALAVLVFLVVYFLRYLQSVSDSHQERIAGMGKDHQGRLDTLTQQYETRMGELVMKYRDLSKDNTDLYRRVIALLARLDGGA